MKRRLLSLLCCLALLCSGCASRRDASDPRELSVWFLSPPLQGDGSPLSARGHDRPSVLACEGYSLPDGAQPVPALLERLLSAPSTPGLTSPFPPGTSLRSWQQRDALVTVDLSEAYGGLSGAALSQADGCIALTLCQLPGVDSVYLTVEGRPRPFRDHVLTPDSFLLSLD